MYLDSVYKITLKRRLFLIIITSLPFLLLACGNRLTISWITPTPTGPAVALNIEVNIVYPTGTATSTPASTFTPTPLPSPVDVPEPTPTPLPPLPALTSTPIPPMATPTEEFVGVILPVEPEHEITLPATVRDFEFKWRWSEAQGCEIPPQYAFELRIWPAQGGFGPLPAMDAIHERDRVFCDPTSGMFGYRVDNLKNIAGAQAVAVQTAGTGPFNWDVALLRIYPDVAVLTVSDPRIFIIPDDYVGRWDPTRPTATCLDFNVWLEAQALFLAAGGPGQDPNGLDPDGNGIACDELRPQ